MVTDPYCAGLKKESEGASYFALSRPSAATLRVFPDILMSTGSHHKDVGLQLQQLTRQGVYVERNIEVRSRNNCCHGKAISTTYSECVFVALVMQQTKRIRLVILPFVACPAIQHSSTFSRKSHDFLGKKLLNLKYVF
jgi:hypothetical protein